MFLISFEKSPVLLHVVNFFHRSLAKIRKKNCKFTNHQQQRQRRR